MKYDISFFAQSALLGSGLATDAFSVSLADGLHEPDMKKGKACLVAGTFGLFQFVQGVSTSIDALSVGFTIGEYDVFTALTASAVIAAVTFGVCVAGVFTGKKFGLKFREKATVAGGIILVIIGIEIFVRGITGV